MTIAIAIFGFAGLAILASILVADMRASTAHQRWIEENNVRRHAK